MNKIPYDQDQMDSAALFYLTQRKKYKQTVLNQEWLDSQPKDLLVKLVMAFASQLDSTSTAKIKQSEIKGSGTAFPWLGLDQKENAQEIIVPASMAAQLDTSKKRWLLELTPKKHDFQNLRIMVLDNFVIGRGSSISDVDLNLSPFDGAFLGVSGLHAEIHVRKDGLFLNDLHSSNGTYYSLKRVEPDNPKKLHVGDDIAFGKLIFRIGNIEKID